ncbi:ECF transporter S component [Solwaraspora sp. WMMD406]|uniref:ECF transporter S component n=1 Tax=Solwaraspora sp. WMMD406 TaxID=3016095 RepID=UPI0024160C02|nr:ECF transporter S component [Solwaraspora sp. WMMD406]MDG4765814.1 ECF transporter S component [Solwaraspora sp. WMMD406]
MSGATKATRTSGRTLVRVKVRGALVLGLVSTAGLAMFFWPLFAAPAPTAIAHADDAPLMFVLILPLLIAIVLSELTSGGIDTKTLAMLGVLSAVNAALRPLGAGTAGIETVFFLLVLAGRVFGSGFGFVLGCTSLFASALLTAGVGPWLPFQMIAAAWVGLGAGLLPRRPRGKAEIALLALYGVVAAYLYGFLMNMWFWPYLAQGTQLDFVPGDPVLDNLHRFAVFTVTTSTFGWDTGRALTNGVALLLAGPAVLTVLRRAARRAAFDAPVEFDALAEVTTPVEVPTPSPPPTTAADVVAHRAGDPPGR